ncbi:hypothetical protein GCM10023231_29710 [Olivibacter ginsenosidimutans]|uniref:DUF5683 domain-containing protein n=1 Tax=Olivibacter ginsenosidimutans TaxID=1176537 RepID=A0ABP9BR69_9SPHI
MLSIRLFLFFLLLAVSGFPLLAQVPDSIRTPADQISKDSLNMTDTTNLPSKEQPKKKKGLFKGLFKSDEAEADTTKPKIYKDSARLALENLTKQAARRSAVLPGWGQLFNGGWGYVKAPIVWAGFGGLGYSFVFANNNYQETLAEVRQRLENQDIPLNPKYETAPTDWLIGAKDFYRRNRDLTILLTVGWYALNIIDAYIDAKFKRYDISEDLTFQLKPTLLEPPRMGLFASGNMPVVGLKATFTIR